MHKVVICVGIPVVGNLSFLNGRIVAVHIAAYKLFEVSMYRQRLYERRRLKEIGKGFSIMHNATTFGWKAYRAMWKKRTREERFVCKMDCLSVMKVYINLRNVD